MIRYVIDASSVGPLIIPDEAENLIPEVIPALKEGQCIVPAHWRFEVANLSLMAVRRRRAELSEVAVSLADLTQFTIPVDPATADLAWTQTLALAARHRLTVYDAAYLDMASRLSLALISLDGDLVRAARSDGVAVVTL